MTDVVKITAVGRSLADAVGLAHRGDFDHVPANDAALTSIAEEYKALKKKVTLLYAGTALIAFLILAQNTSPDFAIDLVGLKLPLSVLSKQALAIFLGAAFAYYAAALVSFTLLHGAVVAILSRVAPEGWEYLWARYDADTLWASMLLPKKLGYPSAVGERRVAKIVLASTYCITGSHTLLVIGACLSALMAALKAGSYFGIILGFLALIATLSAVLGTLCAFFLPLKYRKPA